MKVLLVNGSPKKNGCTYTSLAEVASQLEKNGIETEFFHIGTQPIAGCIGCGQCGELKRCFMDDVVNQFIEKAASADGFVFGSPVYYASMNGALSAFMDRTFYAGSRAKVFKYKPAAAIANARRAGTTATFDQMNKYFTISSMPVVSSSYWNVTHGTTPDDVRRDEEGLLTMRNIGRNMAWLMQCIQTAKEKGIPMPEEEKPIRTNFIR